MKNLKFMALAILAISVLSCQREHDESFNIDQSFPEESTLLGIPPVSALSNAQVSGDHQVVLLKAEYFTSGESDEIGRTVFFSDLGNKQLTSDFVPGDPRLGGFNNIFYAVDESEGTATNTSGGLTNAQTEGAIDRAMTTWDEVTCSDLGMTKIDGVIGIGQVQEFFADPVNFPGFGIIPLPVVLHSGFLPGSFFDQVAPGGSGFILGVTFTLVFGDAQGLTDIDNNGKTDVAIKEIYYNDNFGWNDGATFDVETVALHEAGHALSQAHFGKASITESNGKIHFSPKAVMNAAYSGVQTDIKASDNGGHCSNWASWPNN